MAKFAPVGYVRSVVEEGKKAVWPDRAKVMNHTIMVVITLTVATLLFAGIDYLLQKLLLLTINR